MSGFADLVPKAQPRLMDASAAGTRGATWSWTVDEIADNDGVPIDLSAASITAELVAMPGGDIVLTLTATGGIGTLTVSATSTDTAAVDIGNLTERQVYWYCKVSSAGSVVFFWGPKNSPFMIQRGDV